MRHAPPRCQCGGWRRLYRVKTKTPDEFMAAWTSRPGRETQRRCSSRIGSVCVCSLLATKLPACQSGTPLGEGSACGRGAVPSAARRVSICELWVLHVIASKPAGALAQQPPGGGSNLARACSSGPPIEENAWAILILAFFRFG